jgi:hypothetical protein
MQAGRANGTPVHQVCVLLDFTSCAPCSSQSVWYWCLHVLQLKQTPAYEDTGANFISLIYDTSATRSLGNVTKSL